MTSARQDLRLPPSKPVIVSVDVWRPHFTVIEASFTAELELALSLTWIDQRLIGHEGDLPEEMWIPKILLFLKSGGTFEVTSTKLSDAATGKVVSLQKVSGGIMDMRSILDISAFPFESICLPLVLSPSDGTDSVVLRLAPPKDLNEPSDWHALSAHYGREQEWEYTGILVEEVQQVSPFSGLRYSKIMLVASLCRNPGYYWCKGILPLCCVCFMGLTEFAINPLDSGALSARLQIMLAVLLTIIAVQWTVGDHLPHTPEFTTFDAIVRSTFGLVMFQAIEAVAVNVMIRLKFPDEDVVRADLCLAAIACTAFLVGVGYLMFAMSGRQGKASGIVKKLICEKFSQRMVLPERMRLYKVSNCKVGRSVDIFPSQDARSMPLLSDDEDAESMPLSTAPHDD